MLSLTFDTFHDPIIGYLLIATTLIGLVTGLCVWPVRRFSFLAVVLPCMVIALLPVAAGVLLLNQARDASWPAWWVWLALVLLFALLAAPAALACAGVQALKMKWRAMRARAAEAVRPGG